jgi:hypothetical protein
MNAFYEHHKNNIRFVYRCFDRILLHATIQLCYAKIPSSGFQPHATLLHLIAWLARPQFHLLDVADFKGVRAGQYFGERQVL